MPDGKTLKFGSLKRVEAGGSIKVAAETIAAIAKALEMAVGQGEAEEAR